MSLSWTSEELSSQVDGVATTFTLSQPFRPNSIVPRVNGQVVTDGMTETLPFTFTLCEPPIAGDVLIVHYTEQ